MQLNNKVCYNGGMTWLRAVTAALLFLTSVPAAARTLTVGIGTPISALGLFFRVANFLAISSATVCLGIFVVGALILTGSRGQESGVQKGRDLMTGSLIGLAVILGSYALLRLVLYVVYYE